MHIRHKLKTQSPSPSTTKNDEQHSRSLFYLASALHARTCRRGFTGWQYVIGVILALVLILIILIITGKTGNLFSEKLGIIRSIFGSG